MMFRILRQSFFEGRKRKLLAATTVALAGTLITSLLTLSVDIGDKMAREMKSYGANIRVVPKSETIALQVGGIDFNPLKRREYLDERELPKIKDIFWRNNIVGFAPYLKVVTRLHGDEDRETPLIGTYFERRVALPDDETYRTGVKITNGFWNVVGAWPDDEKNDEALIGASLASALGAGIGTVLDVGRKEGGDARLHLTVTGVLSTGGDEDRAIIAPIAAVQELTGLAGKVQSVEVSALTVPENELSNKAQSGSESLTTEEYDVWYCTAYVSSIAHQIEEAVINASARPIWQVAAGEGVIIGKIQFLMLVVTVAAFISAAMGISSLMNATIMERSREIGLMKALGAAIWEIYLVFLGEAAIVGIVGGLVGCVFGGLLSSGVGIMVFGSPPAFHWIAIPVVLFVSVATVLAGSLPPSRAIARLLPVEVLYGRR